MKTYKSKFGNGILIILTVIFGIIIGSMILYSSPINSILALSGIFLLVYVFFLYIIFETQYTIDNKVLFVKCGFLYNMKLSIDKIKSIKATGNLIASPAPSLDRIELTYGKYGSLIISPKDKFGFIDELTRINPNIENKLVG